MSRKHEMIAKGGRLRIKCEKCEIVRYYTVSQQIRRKTVRCHCGKVAHVTVNRRKYRRESCVIKATISINIARRIPVNLCNISNVGAGFKVAKATRVFKIGQKVTIEYRALSGKRSMRKASVANIFTNHVGVKYTDGLLS